MHKKENTGSTDDRVIGVSEMNRLKNNGYRQDYGDDSWKTYVIRNKKTGKIAEIRAASPVHACGLIGWRPRHTVVLETK